MSNRALVIIDIQNDITKNYRSIIDDINKTIDWAVMEGMLVCYIRHENLSPGTRTFKPNTKGVEFVPELKMVSTNIFTKSKGNALTCEGFVSFINENNIKEFYITGADAVACVKSTVYNLLKENFVVKVIADCITSYDKRKIPEMIDYYASKGVHIVRSGELF